MLITITLKERGGITNEEIRQLERAGKRAPLPDEENPGLTQEELSRFRRAAAAPASEPGASFARPLHS